MDELYYNYCTLIGPEWKYTGTYTLSLITVIMRTE